MLVLVKVLQVASVSSQCASRLSDQLETYRNSISYPAA